VSHSDLDKARKFLTFAAEAHSTESKLALVAIAQGWISIHNVEQYGEYVSYTRYKH